MYSIVSVIENTQTKRHDYDDDGDVDDAHLWKKSAKVVEIEWKSRKRELINYIEAHSIIALIVRLDTKT